MHLVDDEYLIFTVLRRDERLLHERLDAVHRVVGGSVELEDVHRASLVKRLAALALVAGFAVLGGIFAVDRLGKDARACCFAYATRSTEEVGVSKLAAFDCVFKCSRQRFLPHD